MESGNARDSGKGKFFGHVTEAGKRRLSSGAFRIFQHEENGATHQC